MATVKMLDSAPQHNKFPFTVNAQASSKKYSREVYNILKKNK